MNKIINIEWPEWEDIINKDFIPLINNKDRYLILYGGRGSSKSNFTAKKLIFRCLTENYFKCILVKQVYDTIKESSYKEIQTAIEELGLSDLFTFKVQPLEIICNNGNRFIARGMDDVSKLKSIKDPSAIWFEEDIPKTLDDFITIDTGVRTSKADYLQEIFTINPECEGSFEDFWFYKYFFASGENFPIQKTFRGEHTIEIPPNKSKTISYSCHHHTYHNNRWIPDEFKASMELLKRTNEYRYNVFCLGEWGNKETGGLFYKLFTRSKNTSEHLVYNPERALHVSFDFNVNPYLTCSIWQIDGKNAMCIDEITGVHPNNTAKSVCREFIRKYAGHNAGLFIYGDPNGRKEDTRSEKGFNEYTSIQNELADYRPVIRVPRRYPPQEIRGQFINTIFDTGFNGVTIQVSTKCTHLINDFMFQKEAPDGGKMKQKTVKDGKSIEKYGHFSDAMDYLICAAFASDFELYQNGTRPAYRSFGRESFNKKHNY